MSLLFGNVASVIHCFHRKKLVPLSTRVERVQRRKEVSCVTALLLMLNDLLESSINNDSVQCKQCHSSNCAGKSVGRSSAGNSH